MTAGSDGLSSQQVPSLSARTVGQASAAADGTPLVLLHSATSCGAQWRGVQRALGQRFRVIAPDLSSSGHRGTSLTPGDATVLEADIELVRSVLAQSGDRVHLIGHSYGGLVAHRAALVDPAMVKSLFLIEPTAFDLLLPASAGPESRELEALRRRCQEAIELGNRDAAAQNFVDYWAAPGTYQAMAESQRHRVAHAMIGVVSCWAEIMAVRADYAMTAVPTTVIQCGLSPMPIRRIAALLSDQVPGARLVELNDAGHHAPLTHPAAVAREIRQHISRCEA